VVGVSESVLDLKRGQKSGATQRGNVGEGKLGKAAVHGDKRDTRKLKLTRHIFVVVELKALRVDAVVTGTEFVDDAWAEHVGFTERQAAVGVIFHARKESPAI